MIYFTQKSYPQPAGPSGQGAGDAYMHPFKVLVANGLVYVMPGFVYSKSSTRAFNKTVVKLNSSDLADPFLGGTMPSLTAAAGTLWLKSEWDNISGEIDQVSIVFETDVNAADDTTTTWVELAKLTSYSGSYLVEQYVKEDVFVERTDAEDFWFKIVKVSDSEVKVLAGKVLTIDTSVQLAGGGYAAGTAPPVPPAVEIDVAETNLTGMANGDEVYLRLNYSTNGDTTDSILDSTLNPFTINFVMHWCATADIVKVSGGLPTANSTHAYVYLGSVTVSGGVLSVDPQKPVGRVTAPHHYYIHG